MMWLTVIVTAGLSMGLFVWVLVISDAREITIWDLFMLPICMIFGGLAFVMWAAMNISDLVLWRW